MARTSYSLDGEWSFWPVDETVTDPALAVGVAPFSLSVPGVWQHVPALRNHQGAGFYRNAFEVPFLKQNERLFLCFGAVDWRADLWINGIHVGTHENGWLPFEFDITAYYAPGVNHVVVRVADSVEEFASVPHGKQSWYGLMSGIWQSVRVEIRNATHLTRLHVTTDGLGEDAVARASVTLNRPLDKDHTLVWRLKSPTGELVKEETTSALDLTISVPNPQIWEIGKGRLYTLSVEIVSPTETLDIITDTFGFRTISTHDGKILLNGKPYYMRGVLDQDYYPDTDCVPPSQEFLEQQFELALSAGINCFRIHIKVADPRYYIAADKVGMLIWTEIPSQKEFSDKAARHAERTLWGFVDRDWNRASVLIRSVINEAWGIDLTIAEQRQWLANMVHALRAADPSRLVVGNSACVENYQVVTDIEDYHVYMGQPDNHANFRAWVENFASHPQWTYAHEYTTHANWLEFLRNTFDFPTTPAPEVERSGDEPLVLSEFGNWGLPDLDALLEGYGGEPWWFEQGLNWGSGDVYPHGIENRFHDYALGRAFPSLAALTAVSRRSQTEALKFEIEQIRKNAPIQGYVITEWSDLNWESNGLVDMRRNPKDALLALRPISGDTVLIPDWNRLAYRSGETIRLPLYLSHYSDRVVTDCRVRWELAGTSVAGHVDAHNPEPWQVNKIATLEFTIPTVATSERKRLHLALEDVDGNLIAQNWLDLFIAPAELPTQTCTLETDVLHQTLVDLGYKVQDSDAHVRVVKTLTDADRAYLAKGGKVLLLAEEDNAVQTLIGRVHHVARAGSSWHGNWASSACWLNQDKVFRNLCPNGQMDFVFADLMPKHVITGCMPVDFLNRVHAGLYVGWVHRGVATVLERRIGRGVLLVSTLQLSPHLAVNPLAQILLNQMIAYLAQMQDFY